MRIAMIGAKGIPAETAQGGGIETHVETISRLLVKRGHHVTVYVRPYTNPLKRKKWEGIRLITLPTIRSKHVETILHVFFATIHVLFQRVDIIHYHGVGPATLAWIPRLFKPRSHVVVTFHSQDRLHEKWNLLARWYLTYGEWAACTYPHTTIAVSHAIQVFCRRFYAREAAYLPNGVLVPTILPGTSFLTSVGLKPNEYFITLGRLLPVKAHEDAIHAFRVLNTTKKLVIIGEATPEVIHYRTHLESIASEDARVLLLGHRTGEELAQLLAHCYCMIHPSRTEGLSFAVLEAMSYGRMVIMSDIPGNRELVDHSGIAYPVGNREALRDAIMWALSEPALVRIRGDRGQHVVKQFYSWNHIVKQLELVYRSI